MAPARALTTAGLLRARASARLGLLASTAATVAVAVATVCTLLAWLIGAVARADDAAPPGVPPAELAAQVQAGVVALLSAAPALVILVVILAATAAAQLARLLAAAREQESGNARARGLSRRQALALSSVEAAGTAVTGAVAGLCIALLALLLIPPGVLEWGPLMLPLCAAAVGTAALLGLVLVAGAHPRSISTARGARTATGVVAGVLVVGAAFVLWQLRLARPAGFDPIAAVAPTVVLMAGALVVLAVFGVVAAAWAAAATRGPALTPAFPARQVARRLPVYAVAVLLVGLTVAQAVFASAYSATWTAMATDSAALRTGADLRVDLESASATPDTVTEAAEVTGIDDAAPALVVPIEIGSTDAELVGVPGQAIRTTVSAAGGAVDRDALAAALAPAGGSAAARPLPLGEDATGLRVRAAIDSSRTNAAEAVSLTATVLDATGAPAQLRLEGPVSDAPDGTVLSGEAPLPPGTAPWRLLAVTASIPSIFAGTPVSVRIIDAAVTGGDVIEVAGEGRLDRTAPEQVLWLGQEEEPETDEPAPVRAVLGSALAERLGVGVGEEFEFRYAGTGRRGGVQVAGILDGVPGASTALAVFAPLEVLQVSMLQRGTSLVPPASVWASGDPSADIDLSAALDDRPVLRAAPGVEATIVRALVPGWWIATAGAAVLGLIAAFAIVQTLALARRRELGVLRALGVPSGRQARMRAVELGSVLGASVALGALAGVLVSWLLVPALVRAVTPGILSLGTPVTFVVPGLMTTTGMLLAGLAAIVVIAAVDVDGRARRAAVEEEAR